MTWALALVLAVLGAGIECWIGQALRPELDQHRDPFRLTRPEDDPLEVRTDKVVELPYMFADGDIVADIEMGDGTALDVLLRRVEPRYEHGGLIPFHGRFVALRLSADESRVEDGSPFRTREQVLFDGEDPFAVDGSALPMDGGYRATLEIQMRGRGVRARVAGRPWTDWFEAADEHGGLAMFARRGTTIVHRFRFDPLPRDGQEWPWTGALVGMAMGLLATAFFGGLAALAVGLVAGVAAWLLRGEFEAWLLPMVRIRAGSVALLALGSLLVGWALASLARPKRGWIMLPLGLAAAAACVEWALRAERPRLRAFEDPRLELYFAADSGVVPAETVAQRITPMFGAIRMAGEDFRRVFLLGGSQVWEAADPGHSLAPLLLGGVRARVGQDVDVVAPVAWPGDLLQSVRRFERFYAGFDPEVVLVAPHAFEFEDCTGGRVRPRFEAGAPEPSALALLDVWAGEPTRGPAATADDLTRALNEFAAWAERTETPWIAVAVPELPEPIGELLRGAAERSGAPIVELESADPSAQATRLAEAIAAQMAAR